MALCKARENGHEIISGGLVGVCTVIHFSNRSDRNHSGLRCTQRHGAPCAIILGTKKVSSRHQQHIQQVAGSASCSVCGHVSSWTALASYSSTLWQSQHLKFQIKIKSSLTLHKTLSHLAEANYVLYSCDDDTIEIFAARSFQKRHDQ